jgi:hypothetical protein
MKHLPIRIFHERSQDAQLPEGHGGKRKIYWLLEDNKLEERSKELVNEADDIAAVLTARVKKQNFTPAIVRVKAHRDALLFTVLIPSS